MGLKANAKTSHANNHSRAAFSLYSASVLFSRCILLKKNLKRWRKGVLKGSSSLRGGLGLPRRARLRGGAVLRGHGGDHEAPSPGFCGDPSPTGSPLSAQSNSEMARPGFARRARLRMRAVATLHSVRPSQPGQVRGVEGSALSVGYDVSASRSLEERSRHVGTHGEAC